MSSPRAATAVANGAGLKTPDVVVMKWRRKMEDGFASGSRVLPTWSAVRLSSRHRRYGRVSPLGPRMILSRGKRLQLGRCRGRLLQRQRGKARKALRSLLDLGREQVVGRPRQRDRLFRVGHSLEPGRGHRQHGQVDAHCIHGRQPQVIEVGEAALDLGEQRVGGRRPGNQAALHELGCRKMLLERDPARLRLRS